MYGRHNQRSGFGAGFVFTLGLIAAFFFFRALVLGLIVLAGIVWTVSATWSVIPRGLLRLLFVLVVVAVIGIILMLALGQS